jgi:hypothetical protein
MFNNTYIGDDYCLSLTGRNERKHVATFCRGKRTDLPLRDKTIICYS